MSRRCLTTTPAVDWFEPGVVYGLAPRWGVALQWLAAREGLSVRTVTQPSAAVLRDLVWSPPLRDGEVLVCAAPQNVVVPERCHPQLRVVVLTPTPTRCLTGLEDRVWRVLTGEYPVLQAYAEHQQVLVTKPDVVEAVLRAGLPVEALVTDPVQGYWEELLGCLGQPQSLVVWDSIPPRYWYPLFYGPVHSTWAYRTLRSSRGVYWYLRQFLDWGVQRQRLGVALSLFASWVWACGLEDPRRYGWRVVEHKRKRYYNLYAGPRAVRLLRLWLRPTTQVGLLVTEDWFGCRI